MELSYVKEFLVLSKADSYYSAASELYISQSTLSKHIRRLEDELGVDLFDHSRRTVHLTRFGECFRKYAERLAALQEDYREELDLLKKDLHQLTVGSIPPQVEYDITEVIHQFEADPSHGSVEIVEGSSAKLLEALEKGRLRMIFRENWEDFSAGESAYGILHFYRDSMCVILPEDHPLAGRDRIRVEELAGERFVSYMPEKIRAREIFFHICREAGFEPNVVYTAYRVNEIVDMVARGKGVAIIKKRPALYYHRLYPSLRILDCEPRTEVYIDFMYKKGEALSELEKSFLNCVRNRAEQ